MKRNIVATLRYIRPLLVVLIDFKATRQMPNERKHRLARKTVIKPAISSDFLRYWRVKSTAACCSFHSWSCRLIMPDNDQPISLCPRHLATRRARKNQPARDATRAEILISTRGSPESADATRWQSHFTKRQSPIDGNAPAASLQISRKLSRQDALLIRLIARQWCFARSRKVQVTRRVAIGSDFYAEARGYRARVDNTLEGSNIRGWTGAGIVLRELLTIEHAV